MATLDSPVFSMTEPQVKKAARTLEQAWLRRKERRWQRALVHMRRAWACRPALQRSPSKIREALSQCFGEDLAAHIELQGAAVTLTRRARSLVDFLSKGPTCDERAIRIVTEQCQCSRIRAIKALKRNGGGVVDAIMWQIGVRYEVKTSQGRPGSWLCTPLLDLPFPSAVFLRIVESGEIL